jgi:hypothetical protein
MTLQAEHPRRDGKSARQEMQWRVDTLQNQVAQELAQQESCEVAAAAHGGNAAELDALAQSYLAALDLLPK